MSANDNSIHVDLGPLRAAVEERIQSGAYANADEVIRAGLLALEREETATDEWLTSLAEDALADPRPNQPAERVFTGLRTKHGRPRVESRW
jgi:putative addiction module CopG family antidote